MTPSLRSARARRLHTVGLLLALLWAAILRLGWAGTHPFAYDEARLSHLALELVRGGRLPRLGMISSAGVPNLPAAVWLFALPFTLSSDPLVASLWMGLVGTMTVLLAWGLARRLWGNTAALAVAWLMAGSPYLAFYSRSVWAQDWLPFLALLWAWAAWDGLTNGRRRGMFGQGFLAGFVLQVHYAGVVLLPPALMVPALRRHAQAIRDTLLGLALALLLALPALPSLIPHLRSLPPQAPSSGRLTALVNLFHLVAGQDWARLLVGPEWGVDAGTWLRAVGLLVVASVVMGAITAIAAAGKGAGSSHGDMLALTLVWAMAAPLLWLLLPLPPRVHYHLASLPAWFLLSGGSVAAWSRRWPGKAKGVRTVAVILAMAVALIQGTAFVRGLEIARDRLTPHGISTPLEYARAAARFVAGDAPVIVVSPGDDPTVDGDAAMFDVLLWDVPHRIVDGRHVLLVPDRPAWLLFSSSWLPALDILHATLPPDTYQEFHIPKREGEFPFVAVKLTLVPRLSLGGAAIPLANGVEFLGYRWQPWDDHLRLTTFWRVRRTPPGDEYHQFNHIYTAGQEQPLQVADAAVSSRAWRAGDLLITWADFSDLPQASGLRAGVGMYAYPSLRRVPHEGKGDALEPIWVEIDETIEGGG